MVINTDNLVSITEANQNFSRVARMVDENGAAVILKNNVPRYVLMEFSQVEDEQQAKDEDILEISKRLITKNKQAYAGAARLRNNGGHHALHNGEHRQHQFQPVGHRALCQRKTDEQL